MNLNFKGKSYQSFKNFLLLILIVATILNCWKLQKISANTCSCSKQSCDWTFEQLGHYSVLFLALIFRFPEQNKYNKNVPNQTIFFLNLLSAISLKTKSFKNHALIWCKKFSLSRYSHICKHILVNTFL